MKKYFVLCVIALIFSIFSCKDQNDPLPARAEKSFDLMGHAQIGPFINGSNVSIYELDNNFKPTGRTFQSNTDQDGYFELKGVELISPYVEVLADGFYYNEVTGSLSNERMILKAIVDLTKITSININVLTNLEFQRVKYLISSKGSLIQEAKIQSQNELLKIFNIDSIQINNAELLDIINSSQEDAVLLAISCILQANRTTAELTKLQADIVLDMKKDGILNDTLLQSSLISQSLVLNLNKIRQNLIVKYKESGIDLTHINDFDKYITYFNLHSDFHYDSPFEYPASTLNGLNILALKVHKFEAYTFYSLAVKMPVAGNIKVKIKLTDGTGPWWYLASGNYGWKVEPYDNSTHQQVFASTVNGEIIDLPIAFTTYGSAMIEFYCKPTGPPTFIKNISWGEFNDLGFEFKNDSPMGHNLLALNDSSEIKINTDYVVGVFGNLGYRLKFKLKYPDSVTLKVVGGHGNYKYNFITGCMEFELASSEYGDTTFINGISEIALKFMGKGKISIESNLLLKNGKFFNKTCFITI